jgi:hypothetical protein
MKNYLIWEIVTLAGGIWGTYLGVRTLRLSDKEFLAEWEQAARKNAKRDGITEEEAIRRYAGDKRKDPRTWRLMIGGRGLAAGLVLLFAFALIVLLDIGT